MKIMYFKFLFLNRLLAYYRARNGAGLGEEAAVTLDTSSDSLSYSPVPRLLVLDKRDALVR